MSFDSKYMKKKESTTSIGKILDQPSKVKAFVHVDDGKVAVKFKEVPKYALTLGEIDEAPIMGTEVFFEGKLFYPVLWAHKSAVGWNVTKPDFLIRDEMFFFNPHLKREETELDLQGFFKEIDQKNWRVYIEELNKFSFEALKIALATYIKENGK